jgi:hypothetical protein
LEIVSSPKTATWFCAYSLYNRIRI